MRFRIRKKPASAAAAATNGSTIPASSTAAVLAGIGSAGGGGAMTVASPDRYGTENGRLPGHVFRTAAFLISVTIACSFLLFTFNNMLAIQSVKSVVV
jgi:hypothetical protein